MSLEKMVLSDACDNGYRVHEMLRGIPKKDFSDEPAGRVFAGCASITFLKSIIMSVIFNNSMAAFGRFEYFLCLTPAQWIVSLEMLNRNFYSIS
jgi:hypothetical protein